MTPNSGIYTITNKVTEDFYLGASAFLWQRKQQHFAGLRIKYGCCNANLKIAYDKYGGDNLEFKIILYCEDFELMRYETLIANILKPQYNRGPFYYKPYNKKRPAPQPEAQG